MNGTTRAMSHECGDDAMAVVTSVEAYMKRNVIALPSLVLLLGWVCIAPAVAAPTAMPWAMLGTRPPAFEVATKSALEIKPAVTEPLALAIGILNL